jgi:hypothetical protein
MLLLLLPSPEEKESLLSMYTVVSMLA